MHVNRRDFVVGTTAAVGALALPLQLAAQPADADRREQQILQLAHRQLMRAGATVPHHDRVGVADLGVHSLEVRFHVADLKSGSVSSFRVAHGTGSDPENSGWLTHFSNMIGSNASSRGAYVTCEGFNGKFGNSIHLVGLDPENSNAADRSIVMHAAEYCTAAYVERWGRVGRSNGSLAMSPEDFRTVAQQLSDGRLLYVDRVELV